MGMKYIKIFEEFTKDSWASKEVDLIYKDPENKYVIMLPKTHKASMTYGYKTGWCQSDVGNSSGFNRWSRNALLIRFLFKDGFKMRVSVFNEDGRYRFEWGHQNGYHVLYNMGKDPFKIKTRKEKPSSLEKDIIKYMGSLSGEAIDATLNYINKHIDNINGVYIKNINKEVSNGPIGIKNIIDKHKNRDEEVRNERSSKQFLSWVNQNEYDCFFIESVKGGNWWSVKSKDYDTKHKKAVEHYYNSMKDNLSGDQSEINKLCDVKFFINDNGSIFHERKLVKNKENLNKILEGVKFIPSYGPGSIPDSSD